MAQSETNRTVTASGKTGETCTTSGPYKSNTTPSVTIFVKKGEKFPAAPSTSSSQGQNATWTMVS